MGDDRNVPWPRVHEYLLHLSSLSTPRELMRVASTEIQRLIPFDGATGVFSTVDALYLEGIGLTDSVNASYNNYYRTRQPLFLAAEGRVNMAWLMGRNTLDWRGLANLEYAAEFMLPNGMCKSLVSDCSRHAITMAIQRSRLSPDFADTDIDILELVNEQLNSLYSSLQRRKDPVGTTFSTQEIMERFPSLSRREAELCSLVARRLSTVEISACLFISTRTVEKHLENIFDKLAVRSRSQLRWRLGVLPPTGNFSEYPPLDDIRPGR